MPTLSTNCPDGSHFAQMGFRFAQNITTNPCSLLSRHTPLSEICTNTKHPLPTPKHSLSWPEVESGQNKLLSGQNGPQLGKMFEKWAKLANNLEVGKKFIHDRCSVLLSDHCSFHSIALVHSSLCFHHACPWTQTTTDTLINSLHHRVRKAC